MEGRNESYRRLNIIKYYRRLGITVDLSEEDHQLLANEAEIERARGLKSPWLSDRDAFEHIVINEMV